MSAQQHPIPALIVSATHSGAGKTTATASIIRGLRHSGLRVQPFKLGPDFIDPAYLTEAAGRPTVNLDLWMMGDDGVRRAFRRWSGDADIAVIEAMGALYDGEDGTESGSAAAVAKLLGLPVLVVLDAYGMTRTAGAILLGLREFDPDVRIAGCVLNRVGSTAHAEMISAALNEEQRKLVVGTIQREDALDIPERHLGLLTATENQGDVKLREQAQLRAGAELDLERIAAIAGASMPRDRPAIAESDGLACPRPRARLALARDAAFCFYYEENLRLLTEAGFELVPFRPTQDSALPKDVDAVYLGGGYPESFGTELAANTSLTADLRQKATQGVPIYAECGGLLYLGRSLTGFDGARHAMSGLLPLETRMDSTYLAISYVEARTRSDSPLGPAGIVARGQEFHQSRIVGCEPMPTLFELTASRGPARRGGFLRGSLAASYVHLDFASCPELTTNLAASAFAARRRRRSAFSP
jgi:cobyrinic acid a,c-diamide synthase